MYVLISVISIWVFIRTASYAVYEIKNEKNKLGGSVVFLLALASLIFPILMVILRGIY